MSYCPHCNNTTDIIVKKNLGRSAFNLGTKVFLGTLKLGNKIFDESQRELDSSNYSQVEVENRHTKRRVESKNINTGMNSFHETMGRAILGSDEYYACSSCGKKVEFLDCQSRGEYLEKRLISATSVTQKVFAVGFFVLTFIGIINSDLSGIYFLAPFAFAALGYQFPEMLGLRFRCYLNLLTSNLKAVIGGLFVSSFLLVITSFVLEILINPSQASLRNTLIWMSGIAIFSGYIVLSYQVNKQKLVELNEIISAYKKQK